MNLLILTEKDLIGDNQYLVDGDRAQHILSVLKAKAGDTIEAGLLNGPLGHLKIEKTDNSSVTLSVIEMHDQPPPEKIIDLICALPRPQTLKKILLTSAMMAVRSVHFIRANRVEKSYFHSPMLQPVQYRRFLIEGLSQGKRTRLPEIMFHDRFLPFFEETFLSWENVRSQAALLLLPRPESDRRMDAIFDRSKKEIILAVGPEGGWVDFEIDVMTDAGFRQFRLGSWVLRVETALPTALGQIELLVNPVQQG